MGRKVLLIGYTTEKTFRHFTNYAMDASSEIDVLDLSLLCKCKSITISESKNDLFIDIDGIMFEFSQYLAFYTRAYWTDLGSPQRNAALSGLNNAINSWLAFCPGTVVNRPGAGMSNSNKFVHGMTLKEFGFKTPSTFIYGNPEAIQYHINKGEGVELVSKSCSSTRTRTVLLDDNLFNQSPALKNCPSLFQDRVIGSEVRVHCVDGLLLSEQIESNRIDYRYFDPLAPTNNYMICDVPENIGELCRKYCESKALVFAGIDFKVTPQNDWIILEVNPMPGFESYDRRQFNRISIALLSVLLSGKQTQKVPVDIFNYINLNNSCNISDFENISTFLDLQLSKHQNCDIDELFVSCDRRPIMKPFYVEEPLKIKS